MQEVADLYISLRSNATTLVPGFTEAGAAGDRMAEQIALGQNKLISSTARAAEEIGAFGREIITETAMVAERTDWSYTQASISVNKLGEATVTTAAEASAANDKILASMAKVAEEAKVSAASFERDYQAMAASTAEASAKMELANTATADSAERMAVKIDAAAASTTATTEGKIAAVQKAGAAVGLASAAVAVASVKMAGDFEQSTTRLVTSAGESRANLDMVRQGVLDMTSQVGVSAEDLAKALYTIESGGQHGADGLKVLQAAAEGAKTENADLKTVADAVTSVMVDYHLKADDAATVTSKLVAATSQGKTTFQELSGSMAQVLPVASSAHVSLDDILGDLASMTVHGMSAEQSAQNLTDTIRHMQNPTAVQSKELAILGMNSQDLADKLSTKGLSGTLQDISARITNFIGPGATKAVLDLGTALNGLPKAVQDLGGKLLEGSISAAQYNKAASALDPIAKSQAAAFATLAGSTHTIGSSQVSNQAIMQTYGAAMAKATGDATGLRTALMLAGENVGVTNNAVKAISDTTTEAGGHVQGWAEIQSTFNQKVSQAKDGLGALAISIGEKLLPVASKIADVLAEGAKWMATHKGAAEVLAIAVGIGLVVAFSALLAVFWGLAANPVTLIIAGIILAIGLLAFGVYELITHWNDVVDWFSRLWEMVKGIFFQAIRAVVGFVQDWYPLILGILTGGILLLPALIFKYWDQITGFVSDIWNNVIGFLAGVWTAIAGGISSAWNAISGFFVGIWTSITGFLIGVWTSIVNATKSIWEPIVGIIMDIFKIINSIVIIIGGGILILLKMAWEGIVAVTKTVLQPIIEFFSWLWGIVSNATRDAWNAVTGWLSDKWRTAVAIFYTVWDPISNFFSDLWSGVSGFVKDVWNSLTSWLSQKWDSGMSAVRSIWGSVTGFFSDLWNSVSGAVRDGVNNVVNWVSGIGGRILNGIGDVGSTLWNAGVSIIEGFLNGLKSAFDGVANWVGGIASWIQDHKGPIGYDATLLTPHGNAIMQGLLGGLRAGSKDVMSYLDSFTGQLAVGGSVNVSTGISGSLPSSGIPAGTGGGIATGIAGGGGAPTLINLNVYVAGNVSTEDDLIKAIQQGLLRFGIRNLGNGATYAGFGR